MKNLTFLFALAIAGLLSSCGASQALETTQAELQQTQDRLARCNEKSEELDLNTNDARKQARELQAQNNSLQQELQYNREQLASVTRELQSSSDNYGVWFRVQIGAYEDRNIDQSLETTDGLELENKEDVQKVVLGRFREYDRAKSLQDQLQAMGVTDAWIVTYKDGVRVPIQSVRGN